MRGQCQEPFPINAPKTACRFLTNIHHDSSLNLPQHWKVEGRVGTAWFLPAWSMLLVARVTTEHSFLKKNNPCMRWSTKWKSPWDGALNSVNATNRQAERSSSNSWKKFKTSLLRLHYRRRRSRSGGQPTATVQLMCVDVIYRLFLGLLCWQTCSHPPLARNR